MYLTKGILKHIIIFMKSTAIFICMNLTKGILKHIIIIMKSSFIGHLQNRITVKLIAVPLKIFYTET